MENFESKLLNYPDIVSSNEDVSLEDLSDWDKSFILASHLIERGYTLQADIDVYSLANQILEKKYNKKEE